MNERRDKEAGSKKKRRETNLDPYEINFLPQFETGRGPREAFVNEYGVVIGDHEYESANSPLHNWSKNTDPEIMSGDQWVHPFKDIGFQTEENRDYFERGIAPQGGMFMHPDKDVAYEANLENWDGEARSGLEYKREENKDERQD
jgi:hypothetical protein